MARLLGISAVVLAILGCHRAGPGSDAGADAAADAGIDALPDTVIVVLDAGMNPEGPVVVASKAPSGPPLPRPCQDRTLGTVTFTPDGDKVAIVSSKALARASCVRLEEEKLLCDWVDKDGNPTVTRKAVTFGPKKKIGGSYDAKHAFSCPPQDPLAPPPPPKKPPPPKRPKRQG